MFQKWIRQGLFLSDIVHIQNKGAEESADGKKILRDVVLKIIIDWRCHIYQRGSRLTDYKHFNKKKRLVYKKKNK